MRSFEHITDAIKRYLHNQQGTEQQGNRRTLINATSHSSGNTFQVKKRKEEMSNWNIFSLPWDTHLKIAVEAFADSQWDNLRNIIQDPIHVMGNSWIDAGKSRLGTTDAEWDQAHGVEPAAY